MLLAGILGAAHGADTDAPAHAAAGATAYVKLEPDFIVNLQGGERPYFMKITAEVQVGSAEAAEVLLHHQPAIRHRLLMLFTGQALDTARSTAARQSLMDQARSEINQVLTDESTGIEADAVYFTSFVVE